MGKPIIALMYDFDKTLALSDMQNFTFIPKLGYTPEGFWKYTEEFCKKYNSKYASDIMLAFITSREDIWKGLKKP